MVITKNVYTFTKVCLTLSAGLPLYLESWKNLEFDNLGKKKPGKTWNLRNFEKKTGIFNKNH